MENLNKRIRVTTKAIFEDKGKVLMVLNKKNKWELAGGQIRFGEGPKEALKREIEEELGYKNISVGNIVDVFDFKTKSKDTDSQWIVLVYECLAKNCKGIKLSEEHIDYKWCSLQEIKKMRMFSAGYRKSIEKYFRSKKP